MADLKTRISLTTISHEGGAVAGSLADDLRVTPCSFDVIVSKTGGGKTLSVAGDATGGPEPVDLVAAGFSSLFLLHAVNRSEIGPIYVTLNADGQQYFLPVPAGGSAVLATKAGSMVLPASGATLSVSGPLGASYQIAVAGETNAA